MLAANISVPPGVLCGACNVLVSVFHPIVELKRENIILTGDTDGVSFEILGSGCCWRLVFRFPEDAAGRVSIELTGEVETLLDIVTLESVKTEFEYFTFHSIEAKWGKPLYENKLVLLPLVFPVGVVGLTKNHFRVDMGQWNVETNVYGVGMDNRVYHVKLRPPRGAEGDISVELFRTVKASNGIELRVELGIWQSAISG